MEEAHIKSKIRSLTNDFGSVALIAVGVLWEIIFGPGYLGWSLILLGIALDNWTLKHRWRWTAARWPLLIIILFAALSLWVTTNTAATILQFDRLVASLILYSAVCRVASKRSQIIWLTIGFVALGTCLALAAPFIVGWQESKIGLIPDAIYDWFPLLLSDTVHPNVMAAIMLLVFPLPLAYVLSFWSSQRAYLNPLWWSALVVTGCIGLVLLLTRSRGGYIAMMAGLLTALWLLRYRLQAVIVAVMSIIGGWFIADKMQSATVVVDALADTSSLEFRLMVWKTAVSMTRDFPFTGVGMGTFNEVAVRLYPFPVVPNPGAHNLYLQVAVDLGLLGLIAFLAIIGLTIAQAWASFKVLQQTDDRIMQVLIVGLLAGFVSLLVHGLLDITVWGTRIAFMSWALMGLITAVYQFTAVNHN